MNIREIKQVAEKIEAILSVEDKITTSRLTEKMNVKSEVVLVAIGYLLHDDKILIDENSHFISYKHLLFLIFKWVETN